jgi:hypothetical protein
MAKVIPKDLKFSLCLVHFGKLISLQRRYHLRLVIQYEVYNGNLEPFQFNLCSPKA